eukprot:TRINITY_DN1255_c0_g1_i7.p1 TRINITY_DN1255_c0_g1~~TRINITY_DN1255_c0_g1_i7.p1  ORF type:complete len:111 (-),score=20.89 TRINITY_DN1255_c0_g1_i7:289-621(-)
MFSLKCAHHDHRLYIYKDKRISRSNWEKKHLTYNQKQYAALDAIASREMLFGLYNRSCFEMNASDYPPLSDWIQTNHRQPSKEIKSVRLPKWMPETAQDEQSEEHESRWM